MANSAETLYAQQLQDEQPLIVRRRALTVGQNSKDQADAIREDEMASLRNADVSSGGLRKTRPGATAIANVVAESAILGLGHFYVEGGTKYLLMVQGTAAYSWAATGDWTAISGITLTAGLDAATVVAGNRAFILNGTDNVFSTADGTSGTDEGNTNTDVPKSRFGIYHQNMLIVSGNPTNRSYIWPSTVLATQTFDRSGRVIKVADQDNDEVTALLELSLTEALGFMAFKGKSVHFVDTSLGGSDPSKWSIYNIDPVHGAVGPRAVAAVGASLFAGDCVFLSREGSTYRLRSLKRSINDKFGTGGILSSAIEDVLSDVNDALMSKAVVFYFDQRIFLAFPSGSGTYNDTLAVLDLRHSLPSENVWKWSIWTGWNVSCMSLFEEDSVEYLYFGDGSGNGKVFRALSGTSDDGTAISYSEEGRREDFGYPELDKIFQFVEIELLSTDETLVYVDAQIDGNGYTALGSMVASPTNILRLPVNLPFNLVATNKIRHIFQLDSLGLGRDVQIRIRHSELDKTVEVVGYTITAFLEPLHLETRG